MLRLKPHAAASPIWQALSDASPVLPVLSGFVWDNLEIEYDARLILEVALTALTGLNVKARPQVIDLSRSESNRAAVVYGNIKAAAKRKREGVIRGRAADGPGCCVEVPGRIGVRSPNQKMAERPEFPGTNSNLRTKQIGKQVGLDVPAAT